MLIPFRENARNTTPPPESHPIAAVDVYRAAAIVQAEVIGEPFECQCLAVQVWLNRGKSNEGFARKKPSETAIKVAKKVLTSQHKHKLNYFYNPATSTDLVFLRWAAKFPKIRCGKQLFFSDDRN